MRSKNAQKLIGLPATVLLFLFIVAASAQTTAFNFQGRLNDGSNPANGRYDLQFRLYDAITGGTRIGPVANRADHLLINGVFSTTLAFGSAAFRTGEERFLEISVRPAGSTNEFVVLGARQQILSVPFAVRASSAEVATSADSAIAATTAVNAQNSAALGGIDASGYARLNFVNTGNLQTSGSVGFGTVAPNTRLTLSGGASWTSNGWTASMNMQNASAMGWEANGSGQRFGMGQTNNGLNFFRTISAFGSTLTPAQSDIVITNNGDIAQPVERNGLVKAMVAVTAGAVIARCYNGITGSSSGTCGFNVQNNGDGLFSVDFGFPVGERFVSITPYLSPDISVMVPNASPEGNRVAIVLVDTGGTRKNAPFHLFIF